MNSPKPQLAYWQNKLQRMKKIAVLSTLIITVCLLSIGCNEIKRKPGSVYMPDMAYSRAYETYAQQDSSLFTTDVYNPAHKIFYNSMPSKGTIKRGELFPYTLPNDSAGYAQSAAIQNPLGPLSKADSAETSRLFNINCAVCHGAEAKGNGPLSAKIGGIANLTLEQYVKMSDGTMFHSINYGKNLMGGYASQLNRKQRWMIVQYIRTMQPKPSTEIKAITTVTKPDSTTVATIKKKP
jgi:mono/diheme cytochrome c family protein